MEAELETKKLWHYPKKHAKVMFSMYGKNGTIAVGKDVIRVLGAPEYISLRVNKTMDSIMVVPADAKGRLSFKVPDNIYSNGQSTMRFSSIPFTRGIFELNGMNRDKTYQIEGIYIEDRNVAIFNLSDAIVCNRVACV